MSRLLSFWMGLCCVLLLACQQNGDPTGNEEATENAEGNALVEINKKLKDDPTDHALYVERAQIQADNGFFESAIKDLERAIGLDSSKAEYHYKLGEIAFMVNKSRLARDSFRKCIELDPSHVDGLLKLAELYIYVEGYPKAIEYIDQALKVDKFQSKAYMLKGLSFKYMGDTTNAISSFQTAVEQKSDYYEAYIELGLLHGARRDPLTVDYYNNALNVDPLSVEANYGKAFFFQSVGELDKALEVYNTILSIESNHEQTLYNLGYIYANSYEKYAVALSYFDDAIRGDSGYVKAYYMRAVCNEKLGNKEDAAKDYTFVMRAEPSFVPAAEGLKRVGG